jgi:alpha-ketoglutarate-dependent taurine dioxygenase
MNLKEVPHYSILYCERPPDSGGETVLIRGDLLVEQMPDHIRELLTANPVRVHLAGFIRTHHFIQAHPADGTPCFLFADPELSADCSLDIGDEVMPQETLSALRALCDAAPIAHRQDWQTHDLLILDNRRVLHGRRAYTGERRLKRILIAPKGAGI